MTYSSTRFAPEEFTFNLTVDNNSDANVLAATDANSQITTFVGGANGATIDGSTDQTFKVDGLHAEFMDFWLDGVKLVKNTDYTTADGSTVITVKSQTFGKTANGDHTIAAEFREGGSTDNPLYRSAQNFKLNLKTTGGTGDGTGNGTGTGSGGGSGGYSTIPVTTARPSAAPSKRRPRLPLRSRQPLRPQRPPPSLEISKTLRQRTGS